MKKSITLIFVGLILSLSSFANTYLIYRSSGGTWTNTAGITNAVPVNLSTVNGGSEASLNAWFADRSLDTPTMGAGSKFVSGDQVWIISGTYTLTDSVKLFNGVSVYGGFLGSESAVSGRAKGVNAWDFTNETILDGNATSKGLSTDSTTVTTIIDGLSIQNCQNSASAKSGAGASISGLTTTMQNCIVRNCNTTLTNQYSSGGIVIVGGATVKDCYIHHNTTAGYGGGVTIYGDECTLSGCKIVNNISGLFGGGVVLIAHTSGVSVSNCDLSYNKSTAKSGGGLIVYATTFANAEPITISDCTFASDTCLLGSAGALYLYSLAGNVTNISHCTFTSNLAGVGKSTSNGGGAIWSAGGVQNISDCTFTNNTASNSMGGAILFASNTGIRKISNSVFTGNSSAFHGSALMCTYSAEFTNCLFYGNKGANIAYLGTAAGTCGTFNNCTFASNLNLAGTGPSGFYLSTPPQVNGIFTNCLFYRCGSNPIACDATIEENKPTINFCGFESSITRYYATINDCINTVDSASYFDVPNNNYRLADGSPAIDAGTSDVEYEVDLIGNARPLGDGYDMGAYEYDEEYVGIQKPVKDQNITVYRNSSNMITINCNANDNARFSVSVYNLTGRKLLTQQITNSNTVLNRMFSPGIYLVSVQSDKNTSIQKVVIK